MTESGPRVLVVDDERAIRHLLRVSLSAHGFTIFEAGTGQEALEEMAMHRPDLVILDMGLPDMEGVDVTRRLREWTPVPIIILSVREHENDKIMALDAGADDYVTKPFAMGELLARMRVALRRAGGASTESVFNVGELTIDLARRAVGMYCMSYVRSILPPEGEPMWDRLGQALETRAPSEGPSLWGMLDHRLDASQKEG